MEKDKKFYLIFTILFEAILIVYTAYLIDRLEKQIEERDKIIKELTFKLE